MIMQGNFDKRSRELGWCILRMSGSSTLPVVNALIDAGFEVWTPVETQKRRIGRRRELRETPAPITAGIVFAREHQLHDLVTLSRAPSMTYQMWNADLRRMEQRGCPYFSVFRYQGRYPRVADRALDPLRQAERRAAPREKAIALSPGQEVRCPEAGFDGLVGTVQQSKGCHALVVFPGFSIPIQIDVSRLLPDKSEA